MPTAPLLFMLYGWAPTPPPAPPPQTGGSGVYGFYAPPVVDVCDPPGPIEDSAFWKPESGVVRSYVEETLERAGIDPRNDEAQALILYLSMQVRRDKRTGVLVVRPKCKTDPWVPLKDWLKDPKRWDDATEPEVVWEASGEVEAGEETVPMPVTVDVGVKASFESPSLWPLGFLFVAGYACWTFLPREQPVPVEIPVEERPKTKKKPPK